MRPLIRLRVLSPSGKISTLWLRCCAASDSSGCSFLCRQLACLSTKLDSVLADGIQLVYAAFAVLPQRQASIPVQPEAGCSLPPPADFEGLALPAGRKQDSVCAGAKRPGSGFSAATAAVAKLLHREAGRGGPRCGGLCLQSAPMLS
jgi:hypothetical protein